MVELESRENFCLPGKFITVNQCESRAADILYAEKLTQIMHKGRFARPHFSKQLPLVDVTAELKDVGHDFQIVGLY